LEGGLLGSTIGIVQELHTILQIDTS